METNQCFDVAQIMLNNSRFHSCSPLWKSGRICPRKHAKISEHLMVSGPSPPSQDVHCLKRCPAAFRDILKSKEGCVPKNHSISTSLLSSLLQRRSLYAQSQTQESTLFSLRHWGNFQMCSCLWLTTHKKIDT